MRKILAGLLLLVVLFFLKIFLFSSWFPKIATYLCTVAGENLRVALNRSLNFCRSYGGARARYSFEWFSYSIGLRLQFLRLEWVVFESPKLLPIINVELYDYLYVWLGIMTIFHGDKPLWRVLPSRLQTIDISYWYFLTSKTNITYLYDPSHERISTVLTGSALDSSLWYNTCSSVHTIKKIKPAFVVKNIIIIKKSVSFPFPVTTTAHNYYWYYLLTGSKRETKRRTTKTHTTVFTLSSLLNALDVVGGYE